MVNKNYTKRLRTSVVEMEKLVYHFDKKINNVNLPSVVFLRIRVMRLCKAPFKFHFSVSEPQLYIGLEYLNFVINRI